MFQPCYCNFYFIFPSCLNYLGYSIKKFNKLDLNFPLVDFSWERDFQNEIPLFSLYMLWFNFILGLNFMHHY